MEMKTAFKETDNSEKVKVIILEIRSIPNKVKNIIRFYHTLFGS